MRTATASARITVVLNGATRRLRVPASMTVLELLRNRLGLTGAKDACGAGECGACTVLLDGRPALACLVLAAELDGRALTTIEDRRSRRLRRLQRAFAAEGALQCGFCTPGMILAAIPLADGATASEIRRALAGNLCRCTGYTKIVRAVRRAGRERG